MRAHRRPNEVEGVLGMAAPVADGCAAGITQRHVSRSHRMHFCTQHLHTLYIRVLAFHIGSSHEHLTVHAHQSTDRSRSHSVLSGSRLAGNAGLAHLLCQQDLSDGVVDLVGTRVVQVFTFQIELATIALTHPTCIIER